MPPPWLYPQAYPHSRACRVALLQQVRQFTRSKPPIGQFSRLWNAPGDPAATVAGASATEKVLHTALGDGFGRGRHGRASGRPGVSEVTRFGHPYEVRL